MKTSKFTDAQIAFILRQAEEGTRVEEVCRKAGISQQTFYRWKKLHGGLMPSEMKRLKELERQISNGFLQPGVLALELLQALGLILLQTAIFLAPTEIGLLGDPENATNLWDFLALS